MEQLNELLQSGKSLVEQGRYQEAEDCFNQILKKDDKHQEAWNQKGLLLQTRAKYRKALECFDKVLKINAKNAEAWGNQGRV